MKLNEDLLISQKVSEENKLHMQTIYEALDEVLKNPESVDDPVEFIEKMELLLQHLWNFPQDKTFHRYWLKIDKCSCPIMDNMERIGTPYRVYNRECIWHGDKK